MQPCRPMTCVRVNDRSVARQASAAISSAKRPCALDWQGLAALAIYLGLAFLFFARGLFGRFSTAYIGKDVDPPQFMWLIAWWAHAISHGLNPLHTRAVWAPHGINLAWTTCMPLLSLALAPLVLTLGPVFAYNAACLLAIALAGWCAFVLCRYISGAYWPSIAGGYVFGFSAYMLGQAAAHLDLLLVFPVPLFVWLLLRRFRSDISPRRFLLGLTLILTAEFYLFIELFATMTLFAAIALVIVLVVGSPAEKTRTVEMLPTVVLSYAITALLISPYIYLMIALGYQSGLSHPALLYSTDLLNLLIPTPTMELGRLPAFQSISGHFLGYIYEAGGYIGFPLVLIVAAFAWRNWTKGWTRLLLFFTLAAIVSSLGPFIIVGGRAISPAPGILLSALPLIGKALPARLMLYTFLALAPITTLWLCTIRTSAALGMFAALAVILSTVPNLSVRFWTTALEIPSFFKAGIYTKYLTRHETVLVLPYGLNGQSMAWQLASCWYFNMAGGYIGNPPVAFRHWPAVRTFYRVSTSALPAAGDQLRAFLAAHKAHAVLIDDREVKVWRPLMATLGVTPIRAGGMTLYRVPQAELSPWTKTTAVEMETRAARARFAALLVGAEALLSAGRSRASLTPAEAVKTPEPPPGWVVVPARIQPPYADGGLNLPRRSPNPHRYAGMWLAANKGGGIEVGIEGWYPALRQVLDEYREYAVEFTPRDLAAVPQGAASDRRGMLMMTFSTEGLERAAAKAASLDAASAHSGSTTATTAGGDSPR
jgi:hypothetical protein